MTPVTFSALQLLKQLKNDLWCKEVVTGYTTSYTWEANQLGHFAIGFAPTIILGSLLGLFFENSAWLALAALAPILFMVYKELGDIATQQEMNKRNPGLFPLNLRDVRLNAGTAVFFSFLGAWVAASVYLAGLLPPKMAVGYPLITLVCTLPAAAYVMRYWITKKICFQNATLPYTMRLSNVSECITDHSADIVKIFMATENSHLVVTGDGGTKLGTGIGTEVSFSQYKARYGSLLHFLSKEQTDSETVNVAYTPWSWFEAQFVILDDVELEDVREMANLDWYVLSGKQVVWIMNKPEEAEEMAQIISNHAVGPLQCVGVIHTK